MTLLGWQFQLNGTSFGEGTDIHLASLDLGATEGRTQDVDVPRSDALVFGRDYRRPGAWGFTLTVQGADESAALETLGLLQSAWDAKAVRGVVAATASLSYRLGGRSRRVFGRPRRFSPLLENLVFGVVPVVADFQLAHTGSFDDEQQSVALSIGASELGGSGVTFPLSFPVLWGGVEATPRHRSVVVGGTADTFLSVTITAGAEALTDPYVIVAGRTLDFSGTVSPGAVVVVSGAPWARQVAHPDGTSASLTLAAGSRLADLAVPPGQHQVSFGGIDGSGTATCEVAWRNAHVSI